MNSPPPSPPKRRAVSHNKRRTQKRKRKRFSPWREDFIAAFSIGVLALFGLYRGVTSFNATETLIGLSIGLVGGFAAWWAWKNGMRRWYGKHLETWAIERLSGWLKRKKIDWQAGRMVPGLGDADLIVHTSSGPLLIEIKSWRRWTGQNREERACQQAQALAQRLNASSAFIWLPRGQPTFMQRLYAPRSGGVRVVFGNERKMYKHVSRRHTPPSITRRAAGLFHSTRKHP